MFNDAEQIILHKRYDTDVTIVSEIERIASPLINKRQRLFSETQTGDVRVSPQCGIGSRYSV